MGWFDSFVNDVFQGGGNRQYDAQSASNNIAALATATNARVTNLRNQVMAANGKTLDQYTAFDILKELDVLGTNKNVNIGNLEGLFASAQTSQEPVYLARRAESNRVNSLKNAPGLSAQTILTSNIQGTKNIVTQDPSQKSQPVSLVAKGSTNGSLLT